MKTFLFLLISKAYDPLKHREYKPTSYRPEYHPYKPTHVGIYGEEQRPKRVRIRPNSAPKPTVHRHRKPVRTFQAYRNPIGPDIRLGDIGPEYKPSRYKPTPYKPIDYKTKGMGPKDVRVADPLKASTGYKSDRIGMYRGDVEYKLTEDNNLGMRHWRNNFVDDTVAS